MPWCGWPRSRHGSPVRPEPVGPRLEPGLPLGLQRVQRQGLKRPVGDHGNPEPATAPLALGHIHPPDGQRPPSGRAVQQPGRHVGLLPAGEHDAPVDPGRPAASVDLRHPPHAHQSAAAGAEHRLLQAADLTRSPACDAAKIRRLRRRTCSSAWPQSTVSQSRPSSSGPFTRSASNLSLGSGVLTSSPRRLTRPASALFRAGQQPYPASYAGTAGGGASTRFPVSCCLSATGIRFSGLPAPAGGFSFPHGRPTGRYPAGPHRGCHVPHATGTAGVGVL